MDHRCIPIPTELIRCMSIPHLDNLTFDVDVYHGQYHRMGQYCDGWFEGCDFDDGRMNCDYENVIVVVYCGVGKIATLVCQDGGQLLDMQMLHSYEIVFWMVVMVIEELDLSIEFVQYVAWTGAVGISQQH